MGSTLVGNRIASVATKLLLAPPDKTGNVALAPFPLPPDIVRVGVPVTVPVTELTWRPLPDESAHTLFVAS